MSTETEYTVPVPRPLENSKRKTYTIDASNLSTNLKVLEDLPNSAACLSLNMNPDGRAYAVALADGIVNVYLTRNDRLVYTVNPNTECKAHEYSATCVRFRPWGRSDLNPNNLIIVTFYAIIQNALKQKIRGRPQIMSSVESVGPEGNYDVYNVKDTRSITNGDVKTFHVLTGECVHAMNEGREVITCDYSKIGDTFATTGSDGKLNIYDDETREKLITYETPFYENASFRRTYSIAYNPQSTDELITGGWDNVVRYYDLRIPKIIKQFDGPHICGEGLTLDGSGKEICSASWRRRDALQLWDYGSGQLIKNISLSMLPKGKYMSDDSDTEVYSTSRPKIRKNSQPRSSISLPMINGSSKPPGNFLTRSRSKSRPSITSQAQEEDQQLAMPQLLYSCRYFRNSNLIVVGGSHENGIGVINKHTDEVLCRISGLRNSVYCVETHRSKIALTSGTGVALVDTGL